MNYTELEILGLDENQVEIAIALLAEIGYESFMEEKDQGVLKSYIPTEFHDEKKANEVLQLPCFAGACKWSWKELVNMNWNKEWESNYQPVVIGNECIVRALFHTVEESYPIEVMVQPKMSFGTGHHETTSLMAEMLLHMDLQGKDILDMGCGTGILSIIASKKNAKAVLAVDIDTWAYQNTLENISLNKCTNIQVVQGGIQSVDQKGFDIILANINKNVLLEDMHGYAKLLKPNGKLLLSGFYGHDLEDILDGARQYSLALAGHSEKKDWAACVLEFKAGAH